MCDGPTKTFTITVNPTGEVDLPASQVVCNGENTTAKLLLQQPVPEELQPIPGKQ